VFPLSVITAASEFESHAVYFLVDLVKRADIADGNGGALAAGVSIFSLGRLAGESLQTDPFLGLQGSNPEISIQTSVADRFGEVHFVDRFIARDVGDRAGDS